MSDTIKINNIPFSLKGFSKFKKTDFMKTFEGLKKTNPKFSKLDVEAAYKTLKDKAEKSK